MSPYLQHKLTRPNKKPVDSKKIIVVGGTGALGSAICKRAVNKHYNVWSLSQNFPKSFPHMLTRYYHPLTGGKPWPLDMTWKRFDILSEADRKDPFLMEDLSGARTMIHCVGQTHPRIDLGLGDFKQLKKDKRGASTAKQPKRTRDEVARESFEASHITALKNSLELAKQLNVRNFVFISVSGIYPLWPLLYDDQFLPCKRRAEEILAGDHFTADGWPMNMCILRPMFFYTDRRPVQSSLAMTESILKPDSSPASTKLTADRVARAAFGVAEELDTSVSTSEATKWVLEDDDIFRFAQSEKEKDDQQASNDDDDSDDDVDIYM